MFNVKADKNKRLTFFFRFKLFSIKGGELFELVVADDFSLTENDCVVFLQQICNAVQYMHTKNIMHLDLKV